MIPSTVKRVPLHTSEELNAQIRQRMEANVARYASASNEEIEKRLRELDQEWDIERTLEANAATISLLGLSLGAFVNRKLFALPAAVAGFLLQHAIQGWCPPVILFRKLGIRTQSEIEQERYALKALRGDFDKIHTANGRTQRQTVDEVLRAVRK